MDNCILYDWFTVSFANEDYKNIIHLLGMDKCNWEESQTGSRLRYGHRLVFDGVSLHYTDDWDRKHNQGCCLEMSGQGCRDFETFGHGDWWVLFEFIRLRRARVTRIDIAYDDFSGVLPLSIMADMARYFYFTARSQSVRIIGESPDGVPDHFGLSVCHGSKSSDLYIRCYDKRIEKHAYEMNHWVRFEVQLRNDNCKGFIEAPADLGVKFRGVIAQYLNYRCPDPDDSNKRRWHIAPWWQKFLDSAAALSVNMKRDIEYNKDRLDAHIYDRNHNSIKTAILTDGLPAFLSEIFGHSEELPQKYSRLMQASENSAEILRILGETETEQLADLGGQLRHWEDAHGINRPA